MKYLILFVFFTNILLASADQTAQIAQKLSSLEQELYNHEQPPPNIVYDPFYPKTEKSYNKSNRYIHKKKQKKRYFTPNITMILNKKAFINGKWYKENMKIADYVIYKISEDTVFLKKRGKLIALKLSPSKSILTAKEE